MINRATFGADNERLQHVDATQDCGTVDRMTLALEVNQFQNGRDNMVFYWRANDMKEEKIKTRIPNFRYIG
jgi:hypothetical protein